jgi:hypothetical protein
MSWSDARASLNSASVGTTNVNGTVIDLLGVRNNHAVQYNIVISVNTAVSLSLQGSLDNANWYDMGAQIPDYGTPVGAGTYHWAVQEVTGKPAAYLRVVGFVDAGTATVTAYVTADIS